ncbi:unnamed product [Ostreococcus tauri]|uniref:Unnamed product n=1 Tax=Ostreococcus tauri TaxID=70448 RepID=A0A090M2P4_OSTTA|nr:unnamed product [Ostreococcus tauri]CEF98525.1 unnamed product [Ostreococcus tauri]|eukprot:XP_022839310.1 unnamed product [Ostreococcus tauri]
MSSDASPSSGVARAVASPLVVFIAFLLLDCFKLLVTVTFDLEPVFALQREIARSTRSLARSGATEAGAVGSEAATTVRERRLERVRGKLKQLERRRSGTARNAARAAHWTKMAKAALGVAFAIGMREIEMFRLPREFVFPLGKWLKAPLAEAEPGAVSAVAWTLLCATASERVVTAIVSPVLKMFLGGAMARR